MGRKKHICQEHGFIAETDKAWKHHLDKEHTKSLDGFIEKEQKKRDEL